MHNKNFVNLEKDTKQNRGLPMEAVESFVEILAQNPDKDFILGGDFMSWDIIVCSSEKKFGFRI